MLPALLRLGPDLYSLALDDESATESDTEPFGNPSDEPPHGSKDLLEQSFTGGARRCPILAGSARFWPSSVQHQPHSFR